MTTTEEPRRKIELLPDPEPRPVAYTLISVDDHLVEPGDMFDGRLPEKYQHLAPRIVKAAAVQSSSIPGDDCG